MDEQDLSLLAHEDGIYEWLPPSDYRIAVEEFVSAVHEAIGDIP